jgi:hypothetical protein
VSISLHSDGSLGRPQPAVAPAAESSSALAEAEVADPVLCGHCGRTASNGITCQGMCVADSGY